MTCHDYEGITKSVRDLLEGLDETCNDNSCEQGDWAGCVLRFAGHDFMDFNSAKNQGGADGCLDFDDGDNKGLAPCLHKGEFGASLLQAYQQHCATVSLADFTVIAAEAIMTSTRERSITETKKGTPGDLDFKAQFKFGRATSITCHNMDPLPAGDQGCEPVERVFRKQMQLSWDEATALMAVHTLGRARTENSGFNGWWADAENQRRFNNHYFRTMLGNGWMPFEPHDGLQTKFQWMRSDLGFDKHKTHREMMLDSDLCLFMDPSDTLKNQHQDWLNLGNQGTVWDYTKENKCCSWVFRSTAGRLVPETIPGTEHCGGSDGQSDLQACCRSGATHMVDSGMLLVPGAFSDPDVTPSIDCFPPDNTTTGFGGDAVRRFAESEAVWLMEFKAAWKKATENGFKNLKSLEQCS